MVTCVTKCASKMSFDFGPKIYLRGAKSSVLIHGGFGHRPPQMGSWIYLDILDLFFLWRNTWNWTFIFASCNFQVRIQLYSDEFLNLSQSLFSQNNSI